MFELNNPEMLFAAWALLFQVMLVLFFALRKWRFDISMRYGWIVYTMSILAVFVSIVLMLNGVSWRFWSGGFVYLAWAAFGHTVDNVKKIQWRHPILWPVFVPYLFLYLMTQMFYWWPLALISRTLWYIYAVLFIISTLLNVTSHKWKNQKEKK